MGLLHIISALGFGTTSDLADSYLLLNPYSVWEIKLKGSVLTVTGYPPITSQYITSHYSQ